MVILKSVDSPLGIIRQQTTLSPIKFENYLVKWGPGGVSKFITHYYFDFLYPFVYAVFLAACLVQTKAASRNPWIILLPFFACAFDQIENSIQLPMTLGWIDPGSPLFYVAAVSAQLKWLLAAVSVVIILIALVRKLRNKIIN